MAKKTETNKVVENDVIIVEKSKEGFFKKHGKKIAIGAAGVVTAILGGFVGGKLAGGEKKDPDFEAGYNDPFADDEKEDVYDGLVENEE